MDQRDLNNRSNKSLLKASGIYGSVQDGLWRRGVFFQTLAVRSNNAHKKPYI